MLRKLKELNRKNGIGFIPYHKINSDTKYHRVSKSGKVPVY